MRFIQHISFWLAVGIFLIITFGQADDDYSKAAYFITFLLPVAVCTSYFFNYWLVPQYLLTRRYFKFALYMVYTIITSLYFEMIVLTIAFIVLANYKYADLNPYTTNILLMTSTLYFIVLMNAFVLLIKRYQRKEHILNTIEAKQEKNKVDQIVIKADRLNKPIVLKDLFVIESLADYVKLHTQTEQIITKEKISDLHSRLPEHFIRVHRSFIINKNHVQAFGKEEVTVGPMKIKISRTYKTQALKALEA